jgi:serine/threonine-protein phosphatase 4 catalytic subunit
VVISGNIHGHLEDLTKLFTVALRDTDATAARDLNWLFIGCYVDHGRFSLNTFLLLARHQLGHPTGFFLLRLSHQSPWASPMCGFLEEILEVFDLLPLAALTDDDI